MSLDVMLLTLQVLRRAGQGVCLAQSDLRRRVRSGYPSRLRSTASQCLLAIACGLVVTRASAQLAEVDPDWKEGAIAEPPQPLDLSQLEPYEVSKGSELRWFFDPQTMRIDLDGVVRTVIVAKSPSGVNTVMYEGIRCATSEFKLYARYQDGQWVKQTNPDWKDMRTAAGQHALRLARDGACLAAVTALSVRDVVQKIRYPATYGK